MKNIFQSTAFLLLLQTQSQVYALSTTASKPVIWILVANWQTEQNYEGFGIEADAVDGTTQLVFHEGPAKAQSHGIVHFKQYIAAGDMTFTQGKDSFRVFVDKTSKQISLESTSVDQNKAKHYYESLSLTPNDVPQPYLTFEYPPPPGSNQTLQISQSFLACPIGNELAFTQTYLLYTNEPSDKKNSGKCKDIFVRGHRIDQPAK
ncbi:hypothetical protein BCR37DRAFT_388718 [Protomyces lactucae-debilis]|uniref:Uncharacterized protein n=1 Tax=Protomyces lactucae-debilis TaxID=2754530 RepID=A0A1Y2F6F0_PROLT|nr:uncharacterized protein BCR37DRAFT_388718 [Protomyces lactucae-debilis]ORY78515.1 hypothetical protein BCR37DRAFT_388718 [Protomyces lactucae-debilis]